MSLIRKKILLSIVSVALGAFASEASDFDYSKGILIVNEDWYGHQNSSVNQLLPDEPNGEYWNYRIIREENPGMELGCTNQYAALWNGRLYCIAKQEKDPGADISGGRITVCDAKSMKILFQRQLIDDTGAQCDGRAFVGINESKGYISTSNGIWIFDLDSLEIKGMVEGSINPYAGGENDKPNTDPTGALYHGQSGVMIYSDGKVFAAHQQYGLLIINVETDSVTDIISMDIVNENAGIGSLVQSQDGNIWCSVAKNTQGLGSALDYLVKVDPITLDYEIVELPEGIYGPLNSWYAWTPDPFIASPNENVLYWKGGTNTWFSGLWIFKYDIDKDEYSLFINLEEDPDDWKLYGCSIGIHPDTDEIYMSLYHQFGKPEYMVRRYSPHGEIVKEYPMIENYWFPSVMIFPTENTDAGLETPTHETLKIENTSKVEINGKILKCLYCKGKKIDIYTLQGQNISSFTPSSDHEAISLTLRSGLYILKTPTLSKKFLLP